MLIFITLWLHSKRRVSLTRYQLASELLLRFSVCCENVFVTPNLSTGLVYLSLYSNFTNYIQFSVRLHYRYTHFFTLLVCSWSTYLGTNSHHLLIFPVGLKACKGY